MLNGTGRHRAAAGLRIRQRVVFLAATLALCMTHMPVQFMAAAFLISHIVMVELGIYARALILARLFLVIPEGFRPVFRRLANEWVAAGLDERLAAFMARTIRGLFFVHGCLAVLVLVNFPRVMTMVFDMRRWADESYTVFTLVLPGLIFFSAVTALEPIFEARQQTEKLKQMTLAVSIANLILNLNLIPFAGLAGAAMATAGAMFLHFWLFCRMLPPDLLGLRIFWPGAAAALYLTHVLLAFSKIGVVLTLLMAPVLFATMLCLVGFFSPLARVDASVCTVRQPTQ